MNTHDLEILTLAYLYKRGALPKVCKEYYSTKPNRLLYEIVHNQGTVLPPKLATALVKKKTEGKKDESAYMETLRKVYATPVDKVTEKAIEQTVDLIADQSGIRSAQSHIAEADRLYAEGKPDEAEAELRKALKARRTKVELIDYLSGYENRLAVVKERQDKGIVGVPTGLNRFDVNTGGLIMAEGEFGVILGQTGIGKSVAMQNFAINAWVPEYNVFHRGHNVLYISLEMRKQALEFRMDSRLTQISHGKYRTGKGFDKASYTKWGQTVQRLRHTQEHFLEVEYLPRGSSFKDIIQLMDRVQDQQGKPIDLLLLDYINIVGKDRGWEGQVDNISQFEELCKSYNGGRGVAGWTGNQLTDDGEGKKELKTSNVKYGRGIAEAAPIILGLVQTPEDLIKNELQLQFVKMRAVKKVAPLILRPNYDIFLLTDEVKNLKSLETL